MPPARTPAPRRSSAGSNLVAGIVGGLVVAAVGGTLIGTGVINTGDTRREVVREVAGAPGPTIEASTGQRVSVNQIYRRAAPGVVFITARVLREQESPFGLPLEQEGLATGSGFVLDESGNILTNAHVVEGAGDVRVRFEENGDLVPAKVVGRDISTDIAVIKVDPKDAELRPLRLADSSSLRVGDPVVAIGNPFGFDRTVTTGIVSALQRQITAPNGFEITDVIQTDAAINPGNSGGPLLNARGLVVGINSQIATRTGGSVGIGFAVPSNTAKRVVPELEEHGKVRRAYLGITTRPVTPALARAVNLPTERGVLLQDVTPGGPADRAGLEAGGIRTEEGVVLGGDVIVKVAGREVRKPEDVSAAIANRKPGETIEIEFYRDEELQKKKVKLGTRPAAFDAAAAEPPPEEIPFP